MQADINSDGFSRDCAVVVVDTSLKGRNRFGIVIFNQVENQNSIAPANWLYRNKDLSTSVLGWSRDGLSVKTYKENNDFDLCYVTWDKQDRSYFCKKFLAQ